jgi:hypothetical protein
LCEHCEHVWIAALGSVKVFPNFEATGIGVFNRVLTELGLSSNKIGDEGAKPKAIAEALKVNAVLTSVDLRLNSIRDDGAKAIAEALKVNAVLTKLDLEYNSNMGEAGKKAVRDAVKDRSGFVLQL